MSSSLIAPVIGAIIRKDRMKIRVPMINFRIDWVWEKIFVRYKDIIVDIIELVRILPVYLRFGYKW